VTPTTRRIQYWYQTDTCASRIGLEQNTWLDIYWSQNAYLIFSLVVKRHTNKLRCETCQSGLIQTVCYTTIRVSNMNKLLARKNTNKKPHFSERRLIARHFRAAEVSISAEANTSSTSSPDPTKDDDTRVFIITRFKHTLGSINLQIKIS
jgi:hypothetical protein